MDKVERFLLGWLYESKTLWAMRLEAAAVNIELRNNRLYEDYRPRDWTANELLDLMLSEERADNYRREAARAWKLVPRRHRQHYMAKVSARVSPRCPPC